MSTTLPTVLPPLVRVPNSTYRLQLRHGFGFRDAARVIPFLSSLGVTECYLSPPFTAREGSEHGYDVCDPGSLDPAIGGDAGFAELARALRAHDMGLILDIVPNHMATDANRNAWWRDVLARGRESAFARFFDVDWGKDPSRPDRILLPVLGKPYGEALESGDIRVAHSRQGYVVRIPGHELPLTLPKMRTHQARALNGRAGDRRSFDRLHDVLEAQPYRLASWRLAADELNYRRFFNIDDLIGMRVEDREVFDATHALIGRLIARGIVTGLRVDHPDGLARPEEYLRRLAELAARHGEAPLYVLVEKILTRGETLPAGWPVQGTTGYEFLNVVNGIFIDPSKADALAATYARFAGRRQPFADVAEAAKRLILDTVFAGDVDRVTGWFVRAARGDRTFRDLSRRTIRRALVELVVAMPVYRTYATEAGCDDRDRAVLDDALAVAGRKRPEIDASAFDFLGRAFVSPGGDPDRARAVLRAQQLMAAVFAKAIEDTAFYRDTTLVSLNEVGGDPGRTGAALAAFHAFNRRRAIEQPLAMSATATHDTKLGEDSRARLDAISELAGPWRAAITEWRRLNAPHRARAGGLVAPDRHEEYRFYQALVAIWPPGPGTLARAPRDVPERILAYMIKSIREARRHTGWTSPNDAYEIALTHFVRASLADARFVTSIASFARLVARAGAVNSLVQVLLKAAAPGVPDIYQGCERWSLQLVDPDNRQRHDFAGAAAALGVVDRIAAAPGAARLAAIRGLVRTWHDGRIKLYLTARLLRFRRQYPGLFLESDYEAIACDPATRQPGVVAFVRRFGDSAIVAIAPRLAAPLATRGQWPIGEVWGQAGIRLPAWLAGRRLHEVVTGATIEETASARGVLPLRRALAHFPVALLSTEHPRDEPRAPTRAAGRARARARAGRA